MTISITLPLPPKELSPNARVHWAAKHSKAKRYRLDAWKASIGKVSKDGLPWPAAQVRPTFYFKTNRRRDIDNALASLKPAFDGLADAGLVENDSAIIPLPAVLLVDAADPRVELLIERVG